MKTAKIYQPTKNAMQSGRAGRKWVVEFDPAAPEALDGLMGWTGSSDMRQELHLRFDSREAAEAYAERNGITYRVVEPQQRAVKPKSYASNFAFNRVTAYVPPKEHK
ncbi:MAG: ETC complex I subunit [Alphaproteobacteria bacterium]|nr:ETC complex I subunit [Alphaproteobacteria bacterium]